MLHAAAMTQTVYLCFRDREERVAGCCHHSDSVLVFQGHRGRCCRLLPSLRQCTCVSATERKVLQAAAMTQTDTGAPVIIHPGRNSDAPAEIIRILQEAGGDITKTVMSHLDRKCPPFQGLCKVTKVLKIQNETG